MPFQFRKEAIEEDLNSNFPSQGQGNPPLYYSLSEVVVPTYSINSTAEGSGLPSNLQTAWDFSTGQDEVENAATTIINNTGFWQIDVSVSIETGGGTDFFQLFLTDGVTNKIIWRLRSNASGSAAQWAVSDNPFIVFVNTGQSIVAQSGSNDVTGNVWYRQIATINGQLTNPLGFSFA